jgi:hypothetical protein
MSNSFVTSGMSWLYDLPNMQMQQELFNLSLLEARLKRETQQLALTSKDAATDPQAMLVTEQRMQQLNQMNMNLNIRKKQIADQMQINSELKGNLGQFVSSLPGSSSSPQGQ